MATKKVEPQLITVYHATTEEGAAKILEEGFKPSGRPARSLRSPVWVSTIPPDAPNPVVNGISQGHRASDLVSEVFGKRLPDGSYPKAVYIAVDGIPRSRMRGDPDAPWWKFSKVVPADVLNGASKPVIYHPSFEAAEEAWNASLRAKAPSKLKLPPEPSLRSKRSESFTNPLWREHLIAGNPDTGYRRAVEAVNHRVIEFVRAAYKSDHHNSFITNHGEIDRIVALAAPAVEAGQLQIAQLTNAHLAELFGLKDVPAPNLSLLGRDGVDLKTELARPFWTAVRAAQQGKPIEEALALGEKRMERMLKTDMQIAKVKQSREALKASEFQTYQRVAGPQACWLCAIAATQTYYTKDLLPIHPGCGCDVAPMPPGGQKDLDKKLDPEHVLSEDASQVKLLEPMVESDAAPADYRELIAVREHGETGPTLTWAHQKFTGPGDLPVPPSREVLSQQVWETVRANGGITIDLAGHQPTDGYAYAPYKTTEFKVKADEFTPRHVTEYIDGHAKELALPGNNLGMWTQDGYIYLDVSKVGAPTVDTLAKAQRAQQLAVFDLGNFNEIQLGTIDSKGYHDLGTPADLHRQYREQVARADESRSPASIRTVPAGVGRSGAGRKSKQLDDEKPTGNLVKRFVSPDEDSSKVPGASYLSWWPETKWTTKEGKWLEGRHPGLVTSFMPKSDSSAVKSFASGIDSMMKKYPKAVVQVVDSDDIRGGTAQTAYSRLNQRHTKITLGIDDVTPERVKELRAWHSQDPSMMGLLFPTDKDIFQAAGVHEFGHVLCGTGDFVTEGRVKKLMTEMYRAQAKLPGGIKDRSEWEMMLLPSYARQSVGETIAECFADVELNGKKASEFSHRVHDMLIEDYEAATSGRGKKPKSMKRSLPPSEVVAAKEKSRARANGITFDEYGDRVYTFEGKTYQTRMDYENAQGEAWVRERKAEQTGKVGDVPLYLKGVDPQVQKEIERTTARLTKKYPHSGLREITSPRPDEMVEDSVFASTSGGKTITVNTRWFGNRALLNGETKRLSDTGFSPHLPKGHFGAEQTIVHEFGHVLDYQGLEQTKKHATKALKEAFLQDNPRYAKLVKTDKEKVKAAYQKWLEDSLSDYSFQGGFKGYGARLNMGEAIADAFCDVEMNGDKASHAAHVLHDLVVKNAEPEVVAAVQEKVRAERLKKIQDSFLMKATPAKAVADKEAKRLAAEERSKARAEAKAAKEAAAAEKAAAKAEKERLLAEKRGPAPGETRKLLPDGTPLPEKAERIAALQKREPELVAAQESRYKELTDAEKTAGRRWYADQCTMASNQALDGNQGFTELQGVAVNVALSPQNKYDWNTKQAEIFLGTPRGEGFDAIRNIPKGVVANAMKSNAERAVRLSSATTYEEVMDALHEKGDSKKLSNYLPSAWVKGHPQDIPKKVRDNLFTVDTWAVRTMDHTQAQIREALNLPPGTRLTDRQEARGEAILNGKKYGMHWSWSSLKNKWEYIPNYRSVDMIADDYDVFQRAGVTAAKNAPLFAGTYESRFNPDIGRWETVMVDDKPSPWNPEDYQAALWGQIVPAAPPGTKK